jgi:hypothetical protein
VAKIVGKRLDGAGVAVYRVRWRGYAAADDTWEPAALAAGESVVKR